MPSESAAIDLALRQVAEPPLDSLDAVTVDRLDQIAGDEQACVADATHDLERVGGPLYGRIAEEEKRPPVVPRSTGVASIGSGITRASTPSSSERLATALAVHDHAVETRQQAPPEIALRGGAPRSRSCAVNTAGARRRRRCSSACGATSRWTWTTSARRQLQAKHPERMLYRLERHAQSRAAEDARAERVEELAPAGTHGSGRSAKRKRDVTSSTSAPSAASAEASSWS